jgi:hypothetical protein
MKSNLKEKEGARVGERSGMCKDGDHNHTKHGGLDHPCVAPAIWGSLLLTLVLVIAVVVVSYCCRVSGVARRRKKQGISLHQAAEEYEEYWFARLESGGLMILTVAAMPIFIEYARHPGECSGSSKGRGKS